jgi:hypothetical protein
MITTIAIFSACSTPPEKKSFARGTFGYDVDFLNKHDSVIVLSNGDGGWVVVSPKYQAKVLTSTAEGDSGTSFGWIHYKAFEGKPDAHMNAYGGEDRLWLGPEGGRFSLFFPPGAKMEFANWKTPAAFDTEPWDVTARSAGSVSLRKDMQMTNYAGTRLNLSITRKISVLTKAEVRSGLALPAGTSAKAVGYCTENTLTNTGGQAWTEATGMPCIWMLDMFPPSDSTVIVVPYVLGDGSKPATTDYFGEIPADRIKLDDGMLYFRADGKSRGKLGIHPARAREIAGSYDARRHVLTIISFNVDGQARYLNQEWNTTKPPFSGDAVNAYNDGPLADGSQMGPFYELESVSRAAFLAPGQELTHRHCVYHFTGTPEELSVISEKVLGVSVGKILSSMGL